ncbi:MAG: UTP--glucose-1-phosphate uridylyltransferase [Deltaproteobacteria bacterium]|nr:UTP--glucose-1-phosphate uridylyltransferase [Deltaproteobacteria bacterium]
MTTKSLFASCPALEVLLGRNASFEATVELLLKKGLAGVFKKYLSDASVQTIETFLQEAANLDIERIDRHRKALAQGEQKPLLPEDVEPVPLVTLEEQQARNKADITAGIKSLSSGAWASIAFAGGAGTRFFSQIDQLHDALSVPNEMLRNRKFDPRDPKGVFPISPVGGLSFYEIIIAQALDCAVTYKKLPWVLLLTSLLTHERTLQFFRRHDFWGFPPEGWIAFQQAREPRLDDGGDLIVLDEAGHLSKTGDGHGGVYRALLASRKNDLPLNEFLQQQGVGNLIMHNVDNPAARPFDPARLGFHLREKALFTLSAVRKTDPHEKVGVLMLLKSSGKIEVVEYNVLDPAVAQQHDPGSGRLLHEAGNTNTNLFALAAIRSDLEPTLYTGKKVASRIGEIGASSMEMLNQHITRLLAPDRIQAYEVSRAEYFIPTKNVTGVDSVESSTKMLSAMFVSRLRSTQATVEEDSLCDLHPACGTDASELSRHGIGPGWNLRAGSRLYLCVRQSDEHGAPVSSGSLDLHEGSSLIIDGALPYGNVEIDRARNVKVTGKNISRLSIGRGVVIKKGVRVAMRIGPGARLKIPAGRIISNDIEGEVGPGEDKEL